MYEIVYNVKFVPKKAQKVNVKTTMADGKSAYLMKNHATGIYYDLDDLMNLLWNLIDGKRTISQIVEEAQLQRPKIRQETITEDLLFFAEANLLKSTLEQTKKKRFKVASAFELDYVLVEKSQRFVQSVHSRMRPLFKKPLLYASIVFIIIATVLFAREYVSIYGQKANFQILGSSVVGFFFYYFIAMAPIIAIHEISHALTLVHYGGEAGEIGTGIMYFGPMFYTDTTDAWTLSRVHRIMVYLAGNISTLLIGSVLVLIHLTINLPQPLSHILLMVAFYCFAMSLTNFAPPFETDGYYILSDMVKQPNLRRDAYTYLGSVLKRIFRRQTKEKVPPLDSKKKRIFLGYVLLSTGWLAYIIFQTSLFLTYMGQDVRVAFENIFQAAISFKAIPASSIVIAVASIAYFGMQILGYGFVLFVAVKKAAVKPLRVESINDRNMAMLAYLPPQVSESLSNSLASKLEKVAKKLTPRFEMKKNGRSWITVLRMGGTTLASVQINSHLKKIENEFNSVYEKFLLSNKESILNSAGIYSPNKVGFINMFKQLAAESVSAGNSTAVNLTRACEDTLKETTLYLLQSASGTVWTIEVQPAEEYDLEKELLPSLLLEDVTFTDLYKDSENFKKRLVYGYDSLENLAVQIHEGVRQGLSRPEEYQLLSLVQPIKSRVILLGRTERVEKDTHALAPIFVAYTWSGYTDNVLCDTWFKLATINRACFPSLKEIEKISAGELSVLKKDLETFLHNKTIVEASIQSTQKQLDKVGDVFAKAKNILDQKGFRTGMMDALLTLNSENVESIPNRIKQFKREWASLCLKILRIQERVDEEHKKRTADIAKKQRQILYVSPFFVALSVLLLVLGLLIASFPWSVTFATIGLLVQAFYWTAAYFKSRSNKKITKYPSLCFSSIHTILFASTEAVFGYLATEGILEL